MRHLKTELELLKKKLLSLSSLVEKSLDMVIIALKNKDEKLACEVIDFDEEIDRKEVEVEEDCLKIMALHQPVAMDLRFLVSVLKINNDLERIGDLAVNIASRVVYLCKDLNEAAPFDYEAMAKKTVEMLRLALEALINYDSDIARKVCLLDDEVDEQGNPIVPTVVEPVVEPGAVVPAVPVEPEVTPSPEAAPEPVAA